MSATEWDDDEIDALENNSRCEGIEQGRREERGRLWAEIEANGADCRCGNVDFEWLQQLFTYDEEARG